jgi:hypothetical protein
MCSWTWFCPPSGNRSFHLEHRRLSPTTLPGEFQIAPDRPRLIHDIEGF